MDSICNHDPLANLNVPLATEVELDKVKAELKQLKPTPGRPCMNAARNSQLWITTHSTKLAEEIERHSVKRRRAWRWWEVRRGLVQLEVRQQLPEARLAMEGHQCRLGIRQRYHRALFAVGLLEGVQSVLFFVKERVTHG